MIIIFPYMLNTDISVITDYRKSVEGAFQSAESL